MSLNLIVNRKSNGTLRHAIYYSSKSREVPLSTRFAIKSAEPKATREGYGDGLLEAGAKYSQLVVLTADLEESTKVEKFKEKFPDRFLDVGVAEQNLVTVASGLAAVGKIPFVSSFAMFSPGRNWEQIRTTICYNNRNVKIIGSHVGASAGKDGATHQAFEDIALMRVLPNMTVVAPMDYEQTKKATLALAQWKGPAYLRFARHKTPQITSAQTPFEIGKAQVLKDGKDIAIIACGPLVCNCLEAANLLEAKKIKVMVINCHTIKPLDEKTILMAAKKCKKIITVEEHQIAGGLGGAVAEYLSTVCPVPITRLGFKDHYGESGEPEEILKKAGLSTEQIVKEIMRVR